MYKRIILPIDQQIRKKIINIFIRHPLNNGVAPNLIIISDRLKLRET